MKQFLKFMLKRLSIIGSSRDTGWRVYEKYHRETKSDCAQPVFGKKLPEIRPSYLGSFINRFLEKFLPESMCYIPKREYYYSEVGFKNLGAKDVLSHGWDEFMWKEEPFGFHMQGAKKDGTVADHSSDIIYLKEVFRYFLKK